MTDFKKTKMKKILMIAQSKGGSGKSCLAWLYAQKHPGTMILDLDDGTRTSTQQLAYLSPRPVSFQNSANIIDRGKASDFFEYAASHEKENFLCDLGASLSEQLPYYFFDNGAKCIRQGLDALGIDLEIICVVGGQNIFSATMGYLQQLLGACEGQIKIRVAINDHFHFNDQQEKEFESFAKLSGLQGSFHFDLSRDKNQAAQQKVSNVLRMGGGLEGASVFTKIIFEASIKNLPL